MPQLNGSGNALLTDDIIVKEALRLLKNELAAVRCVHRDIESYHNGGGANVGATVSIKMPYRVQATDGATFSAKPLVDQTVAVTIDQQKHVGFTVAQKDRTLSLNQFSSRYLKSAMVQLAHKVDSAVLNAIQDGGFYGSGTPGTAVTSDSFNDAAALMEEVGVPMDGMISAFISPRDRAAVEKELKDYFHEKTVNSSIREKLVGTLAGMKLHSTAQVPVHTVAAHGGTPVVNGASQTGTSLVTDGWTASTQVLNVGDTFTIADVYEVNPQTYESTGRLQRFVATAVGTSDGSGNLTVTISPGINDGTNTTVDADAASVSLAAYQNVDAAPADNAVITVIGTASTTYREALCFHRDSLALAVVDIDLPQTATMKSRARDPETGLSLLLTGEWDGNNFQEKIRIDILYGLKVVYPELIHRIKSGSN